MVAFMASAFNTLLAGTDDVVPGTIMVKFRENMDLAASSKETGIKSIDQKLIDIGIIGIQKSFPHLRNPNSELHQVYTISYAEDMTPQEVLDRISSDHSIDYAEPKYIQELFEVPDDPLYSASRTYMAYINLPEAWEIAKGGAGNIVIALIDDGVDMDHGDLVDNLWVNPGEIPGNGIDDDQNGYIDDLHGWNFANNTNNPNGISGSPGYTGHGTRVSSLFATTNNNTMLSGASWNCELMVLNAAYLNVGGAIQWGYESMIYAAENGASIISNSWGRRGGYSQLEAEITAYVQSLGVIIFGASGNVNLNADFNPSYPGGYDDVLSVGSTGASNDIRSGFSCYGTSVDIFAPGENVKTFSDNGNVNAQTGSGTSYATPLAASVAALIWTANPDWTAAMVREQLRTTSIPIDAANPTYSGKLGHGRIDALAALTQEPGPSVRVSDYSILNSMGSSDILAGDTLTISVELTNYLAPVSGLNLNFSATHPSVNVMDGEHSIVSVEQNETVQKTFSVILDNGLDPDLIIAIYVDLNDGGSYTDRDMFRLYFYPADHINISTGSFQSSIHSDGNVGWGDLGQTTGQGFMYNGADLLPEAGLMLGRSASQISDNIRNETGLEQDNDFRSLTVLESKANPVYTGDIFHTFDDLYAEDPLGLIIEQEILFGSADIPVLNKGVGFIYKIHNPADTTVHDIRFGMFADWDLQSEGLDEVEYIASEKLAYFTNSDQSPNLFAGIMIGNNDHDLNVSIIDNQAFLDDGFSPEEKWNFLSNPHEQELHASNGSVLLSVAPFDLLPRHGLTFMYYMIVADSYSDMITTARTVQSIFDNAFTTEYVAVESGVQPLQPHLYPNFPNPFNPTTKIRYSVPVDGNVSLSIFDVTGRLIQSYEQSHVQPGSHFQEWNALDQNGRRVDTGIYFCRLQMSEFSQTIKMVYLE